MNFIKVEESKSCYQIALNRPDKKNAFHSEMIAELTQAFKGIKSSKSRYVHICAEGPSFSAGADLDWMKSMKDFSFEENKRDANLLFDMFEALSQSPLPITAKVKGHVMGGANGIVAMCDVVASETQTLFAFSEVKLGLIPAVISPFVLSKMSKSMARGLMLSGRAFTAGEALQGGLIHFQGSSSEVDEYLNKVHKSFLEAAPEAVKETLALLGTIENCYEWGEVREVTTNAISERRVSREGQEGMSAFFEKRKPNWSF